MSSLKSVMLCYTI